MKDLLKNLRIHLSAMIEEIDNYTQANSEDIIIQKKDFKYLKSIYGNNIPAIMEFKNNIKFAFWGGSTYHSKLYNELLNGSLKELILIKIPEKDFKSYQGIKLNYKIESEVNTKLRKAYNPITRDEIQNQDAIEHDI
jgi:hypothetical protein